MKLDTLYNLLETPTFWQLRREGYVIPMEKFKLKEVPGPRRNFKVGIGKEELKNYARLDILGISSIHLRNDRWGGCLSILKQRPGVDACASNGTG
jgi:hypothetical protein